MESAAFARAQSFLNYSPVAKWLAIVSGVVTAILYVALLVVLALFADLMVNRGEIPCLANLPKRELNMYTDVEYPLPEDSDARSKRVKEIQDRLRDLGVTSEEIVNLDVAEQTGTLSARQTDLSRGVIWFADLPEILRTTVGDEAAQAARRKIREQFQRLGVEAAVHTNLTDLGILSLVVRSRSSLQGMLVAPLARWNDWMWADGNAAFLRGLFVAALILALVRACFLFLNNSMAAQATIEAITRLRLALHKHAYRLGTLAFRALGPTEAVGVSTRHLEAVHTGLFAWLTVSFREPVKFALLLLFALLVEFWLALAFLLFALLVWLVGGQIAAHFRRQGRAAGARAADQLAYIQESLMILRLVKAYLIEKFNLSRAERQLAKYGQAQLQRYRGEAFYRPFFAFLGVLAALVLLLAAGYVILQGYLGVTSAMVLVTALVSLYWPASAWLENRRLIRRSRQSARVLFEFLDRTGSVGQVVEAEFLPALTQKLEFDNVTLREPGTGRRLLEGISLTIRAGQRVALVGPDDMEKHALVYLLLRFLDPNIGEVRIDRKNIRWVTLDSLRTQIGMVLQHNLVFNDTVANNIGCGDPTYNMTKIVEAAKLAHAHQFIQKLPQGYETHIGEMGHPLNDGEKFRVALARALLRDPAILVIEEPLQALDEDTKGLVDDTYSRVLPGRTVIFLPHRLSAIRNCDQVFLIHEGRLAAAGDHREMLGLSELYKHLQYLEFNEFAGMIAAPPVPAHVVGDL